MVFDSIYIDASAVDTGAVESDQPDLENTKTYTIEDLTFEYPGNWTELGTQIVGNDRIGAIAVQALELNPLFHILDTEACKELVVPSIEANGMTVHEIEAEHLENGNGENIAKITVWATSMGVDMEITELFVSSADHTYLIAISSITKDSEVVDWCLILFLL